METAATMLQSPRGDRSDPDERGYARNPHRHHDAGDSADNLFLARNLSFFSDNLVL